MKNYKSSVIVNITTEFALKVIGSCEKLVKKIKFSIVNQLLKSETSIAANIKEV